MNSPEYNKFDTPPEGCLIRGLNGKWRRGDGKPLSEVDLRIIAGEDPIAVIGDISRRAWAEADAAKALLAEAKTPEEAALAAQMVAETKIQSSP